MQPELDLSDPKLSDLDELRLLSYFFRDWYGRRWERKVCDLASLSRRRISDILLGHESLPQCLLPQLCALRDSLISSSAYVTRRNPYRGPAQASRVFRVQANAAGEALRSSSLGLQGVPQQTVQPLPPAEAGGFPTLPPQAGSD